MDRGEGRVKEEGNEDGKKYTVGEASADGRNTKPQGLEDENNISGPIERGATTTSKQFIVALRLIDTDPRAVHPFAPIAGLCAG
jgi:hypothetical protein